ncbi:MAG: hypothetical protein Tsb0013_09700 [Phycisphaerales bacterium]
MRAYLTAGLVISMAGLTTVAWTVATPSDAEREVSPFQRRVAPEREGSRSTPGADNALTNGAMGGAVEAARFPLEFRTIDGHGNNPLVPDWGAAHTPFVRKVPAAYAENNGLARQDGPSPRAVSNAMCSQLLDMPNPDGISDYLWQWGQFLDHDFAETPLADPAEPADITIPTGDDFFDPFSTGTQKMDFDRSTYTVQDGERQQINLITAFIDASAVYGSEEDRAHELRTNDGTGRLKTSTGDLLPFNEAGLPNAENGPRPSSQFFLAGDVRANEQAGLAAIHTLFVREHNYWADAFRARFPGMSGDEIFERARAIVAAEMQAITYNEFLPILIGEDALPPYTGYKVYVNPGITNTFATAAYRVGHTMLSSQIMRLGPDMTEAPEGHLSLRRAFFDPTELTDHGITSIMRGLAGQRSQIIDAIIVDDVRNFLFGPPGSGGFDLAALNIQRGRDHGLGSYNDVRASYGLKPVTSFDQINPNPDVYGALASVYDSPDDIDPWIGLLAEPHAPGARVGETLKAVMVDQFTRLRDGDRFWYESYLPPHLVRLVDRQTLGVIIRRNTEAGLEISRDAFRVRDLIQADWNGDGNVDVLDVRAFIADLQAGDAGADLNGDGAFDIEDILDFLEAWGAALG